ncbi:MAG: succinylglutamate desuccinylase/aspartoacylase family protein [Pseudomonadota bacterium]
MAAPKPKAPGKTKVARNKRITEVGDIAVAPGERGSVDLPITDLYTHTQMSMPVEVVNGKHAGPVLVVCAAIHGDEINGVEIVRRLLAAPSLKRLRGTLIAVPIVNVLGFLNLSRYLPDRRDLNRCFPGSATGSSASRLANRFCREILRQADVAIDLHTAAVHRSNLPQIRVTQDDHAALELAEVFAAPVIVSSEIREGSLREVAQKQGVPIIVYEAGEALRFDEPSIRAGVRGVQRVMRKLGMLPGRSPKSFGAPVHANDSAWARAPRSGILVHAPRLGARVKQGDLVATISDPVGAEQTNVLSPHDGIVIGRVELPLVHAGDALCHIAEFEHPIVAERTVAAFVEHQSSGQTTDESPA